MNCKSDLRDCGCIISKLNYGKGKLVAITVCNYHMTVNPVKATHQIQLARKNREEITRR